MLTEAASTLHALRRVPTAPTFLEVDLGRLEHNLEILRAGLDPACEVAAVVKANAYGLGAVPVARRLARAGVRCFCLYSVEEALALHQAGVEARLVVLGPTYELNRPALEDLLASGRLELVLHGLDQARALEATLPAGTVLPVHVEINTGLNRGGLAPAEAGDCLRFVAASRRLELVALMSHAASANVDGDFTATQMRRLDGVLAEHRPLLPALLPVHFASSFAVLRDRRYQRGMVRIGLALLGYGPAEMRAMPASALSVDLRPVCRLASCITHAFEVPAGSPVGYEGTFVTDRPSRLGIVPVGYSSGFPRALAGRALAAVGPTGALAPVVGAISMDQLTLDLTDVPGCGPGTEVELVSPDPGSPLSLEQVAALAGTNTHEMLCRLGAAPIRHVG